MTAVEVGSAGRRPGRRWLLAAFGWNLLLIIVTVASGSVVRNDAPSMRLAVSLGGTVLLISSIAGLLASLVVWALLSRHDRTGARRSLLAARILGGLVVGIGVSSIGAFVGLFLVPTGAALLLACGSPGSVDRWYPAASS